MWQYTTIKVGDQINPDQLDATLNDFGVKNWELVNIIMEKQIIKKHDDVHPGQLSEDKLYTYFAVLKREISRRAK